MTFKKYFGKKTKFLVITILMPIIAVSIKAGCQPQFYMEYTCTPQFDTIYTIILLFIILSVLAWIGIGLYHLLKFIRTRKKPNLI